MKGYNKFLGYIGYIFAFIFLTGSLVSFYLYHKHRVIETDLIAFGRMLDKKEEGGYDLFHRNTKSVITSILRNELNLPSLLIDFRSDHFHDLVVSQNPSVLKASIFNKYQVVKRKIDADFYFATSFLLLSGAFFISTLGVRNGVIKSQNKRICLQLNDVQEQFKQLKKAYCQALNEKDMMVKTLTDSREKELELNKQIEESKLVQLEMKKFVDVQIKTNEQLMIAESKLKNLLEKEKEGKVIMNQTLEKLKETQGQLVHSEKMASLGQLTAGIAHEINNPINFVYNGVGSVKGILEDLKDLLDVYEDLEDGSDLESVMKEVRFLKNDFQYENTLFDLDQLIKDIEEGAIRTIEIVKGLRVFSRLDEEDRKDADINECLDATLILLKNKMKNKITLVKELDSSLPSISCFPGQLNQVFMNILTNAIQAIPEDHQDARIVVKTERSMEHVVIRLIDNGTGMKDEVKNRIFEPFFTTKPVGVGTGLGMSISYGIIEKHHGRISVNSEIGKGTEFVIGLPMMVSEVLQKAV